MRRHSSEGTYINYLSSDEPAVIRASYGGNYSRLAALKRKYDPGNFFHHNRNIQASQVNLKLSPPRRAAYDQRSA
jgi:hypothetical protein